MTLHELQKQFDTFVLRNSKIACSTEQFKELSHLCLVRTRMEANNELRHLAADILASHNSLLNIITTKYKNIFDEEQLMLANLIGVCNKIIKDGS